MNGLTARQNGLFFPLHFGRLPPPACRGRAALTPRCRGGAEPAFSPLGGAVSALTGCDRLL